jgi:hypothetical protein
VGQRWAGGGTEATRSAAEATQWQVLGYARRQTATAGYGFLIHSTTSKTASNLAQRASNESMGAKPQLRLLNSILLIPSRRVRGGFFPVLLPARFARRERALHLCL